MIISAIFGFAALLHRFGMFFGLRVGKGRRALLFMLD